MNALEQVHNAVEEGAKISEYEVVMAKKLEKVDKTIEQLKKRSVDLENYCKSLPDDKMPIVRV